MAAAGKMSDLLKVLDHVGDSAFSQIANRARYIPRK